MALRSLGLCAGIGGIELGLAPWCRTVGLVERDAFAAACLVEGMAQAELDLAPIWSDLRTFDARAWSGAVDLVTAGYPCQPFSVAGNRSGAEDERHLWPEVYRILQETDAPLLFCENVRGHLSLGFADVLADLAAIGFDAEWVCLRASDVGAPHERDRLFFLAHRNVDGLRRLRSCGVLDGERQAQRDHADGRGADVADSSGSRCAGTKDPRADRAHERAIRGWCVEPERAGEAVGDADGARLPQRGRDRIPGLPAAWPPGPDDADGWREWLARGGPAPTQPAVRRGSDGAAVLVDSLRCLGNAVVPAQARAAFKELAMRIK